MGGHLEDPRRPSRLAMKDRIRRVRLRDDGLPKKILKASVVLNERILDFQSQNGSP